MKQKYKLSVQLIDGQDIEMTQPLDDNEVESLKDLCKRVMGGEFDHLTIEKTDFYGSWVVVRASDVRLVSLVAVGMKENSDVR